MRVEDLPEALGGTCVPAVTQRLTAFALDDESSGLDRVAHENWRDLQSCDLRCRFRVDRSVADGRARRRFNTREVRPESVVEEVVSQCLEGGRSAHDLEWWAPLLASVVGEGRKVADMVQVRVAHQHGLYRPLLLEAQGPSESRLHRSITRRFSRKLVVRCFGDSPPWHPRT